MLTPGTLLCRHHLSFELLQCHLGPVGEFDWVLADEESDFMPELRREGANGDKSHLPALIEPC